MYISNLSDDLHCCKTRFNFGGRPVLVYPIKKGLDRPIHNASGIMPEEGGRRMKDRPHQLTLALSYCVQVALHRRDDRVILTHIGLNRWLWCHGFSFVQAT